LAASKGHVQKLCRHCATGLFATLRIGRTKRTKTGLSGRINAERCFQ